MKPLTEEILKQKRIIKILALKCEGWTLAQIGKAVGVTKERVRQVIGRAYKDALEEAEENNS